MSARPAITALRLKATARRMRASSNPILRAVGFAISAIYRGLSLYVLGMDIPTSTRIDGEVVVYHPIGLVISDNAHIESGVQLRQNTTIGTRVPFGPAPRICEGADIGANSVILGGITIGASAIVGAGSVVLQDVPPHSVAVGNPARIVNPRR